MDGSLSMEMDMDVDYGISPPSNPDPLDQNQTPDINPPLPGASTAASAEKDIEEPVLPPRSTMTVFDSIMTHIDLDAVLNCALAIITTPPKSDEDQIALVREIMAILNLDTDSEGAASYQSLHAIIRDISTMVVGLLVMIFGDQNSQPDEKGDLAARFASQFGDDKIHGTPRQGSGEKDDKDATEAAVRRCCWGLFEHQQLFVDAEGTGASGSGSKSG
ncbi:hypothetical protein B0T17DRAFT_618410 [Bombardia bombarda]|uniref:Uncharacterized protein n=1 Tax=Bombardia bombarda TaxID=252184 RepID=A0AA39WUW1_9PEZI|nr:hypothetical protein B0T17DRAFT_618410 [Bombardia bombarda]